MAAPFLLAGAIFAPAQAWAVDGATGPAVADDTRMECTTVIVRTTTTTVNPDGSTTVSEEVSEEKVCRAIWGT